MPYDFRITGLFLGRSINMSFFAVDDFTHENIGQLSKDIVLENSSIGGTIFGGNLYISVTSKYSFTPNVFFPYSCFFSMSFKYFLKILNFDDLFFHSYDFQKVFF